MRPIFLDIHRLKRHQLFGRNLCTLKVLDKKAELGLQTDVLHSVSYWWISARFDWARALSSKFQFENLPEQLLTHWVSLSRGLIAKVQVMIFGFDQFVPIQILPIPLIQ